MISQKMKRASADLSSALKRPLISEVNLDWSGLFTLFIKFNSTNQYLFIYLQ